MERTCSSQLALGKQVFHIFPYSNHLMHIRSITFSYDFPHIHDRWLGTCAYANIGSHLPSHRVPAILPNVKAPQAAYGITNVSQKSDITFLHIPHSIEPPSPRYLPYGLLASLDSLNHGFPHLWVCLPIQPSLPTGWEDGTGRLSPSVGWPSCGEDGIPLREDFGVGHTAYVSPA